MTKTFTISSAYFLLIAFSWLSRAEAIAQNIGINGTGANAHPSALLDLDSSPTNNTGFAMPSLTTTQRLAIVSPKNGLQVFDTSLGDFYYYSTITNKWDCVSVRAGTVSHFANTVAPLGYLACAGQTVSATQYPELFNAIGYLYGGAGAVFNVPDLRGEFIRGLDAGRGIDPARVIGSAQADDFKSHNHTFGALVNAYGGFSGTITGDYSQPFYIGQGPWVTSSTGGAETRPRNLALLPCIKY